MKLASKKCVIRDWQLKDLEKYRYWANPKHEWHKTNGPYYPPKSEEQIAETILKMEDRISKKDFPDVRVSLVIACPHSDEIIGSVSWYYQSIETHWISVGICIYDPQYWGKGIGFYALGLWSQYLFDNFGDIARLDIRTWSGNIGMMKLSEKLGYKLEAVFRDARIVNGEYYDSIGYGVLRSEWADLYPHGFLESVLK